MRLLALDAEKASKDEATLVNENQVVQ